MTVHELLLIVCQPVHLVCQTKSLLPGLISGENEGNGTKIWTRKPSRGAQTQTPRARTLPRNRKIEQRVRRESNYSMGGDWNPDTIMIYHKKYTTYDIGFPFRQSSSSFTFLARLVPRQKQKQKHFRGTTRSDQHPARPILGFTGICTSVSPMHDMQASILPCSRLSSKEDFLPGSFSDQDYRAQM